MPSLSDWKVSPNDQPRPADYAFDLDVVELGLQSLHLGLELGGLFHQAKEIRHVLPSISG